MKQALMFATFVLAAIWGCGSSTSTEPVLLEPETQQIINNRTFKINAGEFRLLGGGSHAIHLKVTLQGQFKILDDEDRTIEFMVLPSSSAQTLQNPNLSESIYRSGRVKEGAFSIQLPERYSYVLDNRFSDLEKNVSLTLTRTYELK